MNTITLVGERELLKLINDGATKAKPWDKPMLLMTQSGDDYCYISNAIGDLNDLSSICIVSEPSYYTFAQVDGRLECFLKGEPVNNHKPDIDIYKYLGGAYIGYDEVIHSYCADLFEYEAKPVISMICVCDRNCSVDEIPAWIFERFEVVMLQLNY